MTMRMNRTEKAYTDARAAGTLRELRDEDALADFTFWKIVANRFPHDRHHERHDLIVLKRDCLVNEISPEELAELWYDIIPYAELAYDIVKLNLLSVRSITQTPHLHLMVLKEEYK